MTALAIALAALFLVAGLGHFAFASYAASLVPTWLPAPGVVVAVFGVANLVACVLLALTPTRAVGGAIAALLITAYLVSHLDAARRPERHGPLLHRPWMLVLRVVVNLGYLAAALLIAST